MSSTRPNLPMSCCGFWGYRENQYCVQGSLRDHYSQHTEDQQGTMRKNDAEPLCQMEFKKTWLLTIALNGILPCVTSPIFLSRLEMLMYLFIVLYLGKK